MENTATTATTSTIAIVDWKPRGRGRRFDRLARGLARRLRIPWVRSTLRARDNPQAFDHAEAYAPVWTSANALADYSFACVCHKRPRYRDRRQPKHKEGSI